MSIVTSPALLIADATLQGLTLEADGDRLHVAGPDATRARWLPTLKANKPALLAYLRQCQQPEPGPRPVSDYTAAVATDAALGRPAAGADRAPQSGGADIETPCNTDTVHDCHVCMHWQGMETIQIVTRDGVKTAVRGACMAGFRPWRVSNIPSQLDFYRWHYIGECADNQEHDA